MLLQTLVPRAGEHHVRRDGKALDVHIWWNTQSLGGRTREQCKTRYLLSSVGLWGRYVASLIMLWVLCFKYPFNSSYSI